MSARACKKCFVVKPLTEFHRHPGGPEGRHSWCKACACAAKREASKRRKRVRPPELVCWQAMLAAARIAARAAGWGVVVGVSIEDRPLDAPEQWGTRRVRVRIRRTRPDGSPWPVKREAEILDGLELDLEYGWVIENDDRRYPGEVAWLLRGDEVARRGLPDTVPIWLPSGDLEPA